MEQNESRAVLLRQISSTASYRTNFPGEQRTTKDETRKITLGALRHRAANFAIQLQSARGENVSSLDTFSSSPSCSLYCTYSLFLVSIKPEESCSSSELAFLLTQPSAFQDSTLQATFIQVLVESASRSKKNSLCQTCLFRKSPRRETKLPNSLLRFSTVSGALIAANM